jgi:GT2 family glycosyltransferase
MNSTDLSVIIVTWNGCDDLVRCLGAVNAARGGLRLQVIVVDNASEDHTVSTVQERFAFVDLLQNQVNVGFPRANNQGLKHATGRHVLLLNPDTEVGEDALRACVDTLDENPAIGAVGCRLLYPDGSPQYECARRAYRLRHLIWEAFYLHVQFSHSSVFAHQLMGDWDHTGERDVEAISGAFLMARRPVLEEVGGIPDSLFMYHEDLSLCLKIQKLGLRIRFLGQVETVHHHGRSSDRSALDLHLLEGPVRVQLIQERSGAAAGAMARVLFAVRSKVRWVLAIVVGIAAGPVGGLIPGARARMERLRATRPKVFDRALHADQLLWAVFPGLVVHRMPRASQVEPSLAVDSPKPLRESGDGATDV